MHAVSVWSLMYYWEKGTAYIRAQPVTRLRNNPRFSKELNPEIYSFMAKRNDSNLNQYNRSITLTWLANTDISVCGDTNAVINYIAKYCSKAETQSVSYGNIIQAILPSLNASHPRFSLIKRAMNRLIAERDIFS